jgi:hypothetical protein
MLSGQGFQFVTEVPGQLIGPIIVEDGSDRLSRNVGSQRPAYAASHPRNAKASTTPRRKTENLQPLISAGWKEQPVTVSRKVKILPIPCMGLGFLGRPARLIRVTSAHVKNSSNFITSPSPTFFGSV